MATRTLQTDAIDPARLFLDSARLELATNATGRLFFHADGQDDFGLLNPCTVYRIGIRYCEQASVSRNNSVIGSDRKSAGSVFGGYTERPVCRNRISKYTVTSVSCRMAGDSPRAIASTVSGNVHAGSIPA